MLVLDYNIISVRPPTEKNGAYKIIALKAKRARGSMARFVIDKRLDNPEDLKGFDYGGYAYSPDHSDEQNWVFLR